MGNPSARPTRPSGERDSYAAAVHAALAEAGLRPDFTARALARIEAHHDELGTSWQFATIANLLRELGEQTADVTAYAALLGARLEHDGAPHAKRARALLGAIARHADEADVLVAELRRALIPEARA